MMTPERLAEIRERLAQVRTEQAGYGPWDDPIAVMGDLLAEVERLRAALAEAEKAVMRKGFRDITGLDPVKLN